MPGRIHAIIFCSKKLEQFELRVYPLFIMLVQAISREDKQAAPLSPLDIEAIEVFVRMVSVLGLPKSVGELYGLIFVTPEPMAMDDLMGRLKMSKGSTSQGLKLLRAFGAIRTIYVAGDRRDHYVAELELRKLVSGFLKEQVQPHLSGGSSRLDRIDKIISTQPSSEKTKFLSARVAKLKRWQVQGQKVLPLLIKMLGA
ncbi:MAG: hypothetical protein SGI71_01990 [Verrucomicrobiota bacterium]|nr:hypothetical protein [Verrucomicrobiota bacterium]